MVSFFNSRKELIEAKTLELGNTVVSPKSPVGFDTHLNVDHLPEGYNYQVDITEGHYLD